MKEVEITQTEKIQSYGSIEKNVKPYGNGAHVNIPKQWLGKRVKVILIEPI